jgi:thiamine transport system substrate-binding protein
LARAEGGRVSATPEKSAPLVVFAYDSFVSADGPGDELVSRFRAQSGCEVRLLASGDGGQALTRLELEAKQGHQTAHVVLGIDSTLWDRARPFAEDWGGWRPRSWNRLRPEVQVEAGFLPFDYGVFALIADRDQLAHLKLEAPKSLRELRDEKWKRKILLEDPRTSTPGLGFLLLTRQLYGDGFSTFWRAFRSQWLTLTSGWDAAYALFLKEEAPLVWSYTTSQAYHRENGDTAGRYQALLFEEGNPLQIEGAFLVRGRPHPCAKPWLDFLLTPESQSLLAKRNWMLPVLPVSLPRTFTELPAPRNPVRLPTHAEEIRATLWSWLRAVEGSP